MIRRFQGRNNWRASRQLSGSGIRGQGFGVRCPGSGVRCPGSEFRVSVSGVRCPRAVRHLWNNQKYLTFRGRCIVIYSYNKINEMHYFSNLFLENNVEKLVHLVGYIIIIRNILITNSDLDTRKIFPENYLQFGHAPLNIFPILVIDRK